MRAGFVLPTRNVVTGSAAPSSAMRSMVACATRLDQLGYDSVWVGDSLLGRPRPEPLTVLAAIAACTERITLGTSALLPAMRHPLQLAQQAATLDLLADGRLILGSGVGFPNDQTQRELDALGIDYKTRGARAHEAVAWCKALWGGAAPKEQRFWQLEPGLVMEPPPAQQGGPKFWLGGASDSACRRVAREYDGWMPTSPNPEVFAKGWQLIQEEATAQGRSIDEITGCTVLTIALDSRAETAEQKLRSFIETYYSVPLEAARTVVGCSSGTVETVMDDIRAFEAAGVSHLMLRFAADDQEAEIDMWAEQLIKALRA